MLDEPEIPVPGEMPDIRRVARDQVVDGDDAVSFRQKPIR